MCTVITCWFETFKWKSIKFLKLILTFNLFPLPEMLFSPNFCLVFILHVCAKRSPHPSARPSWQLHFFHFFSPLPRYYPPHCSSSLCHLSQLIIAHSSFVSLCVLSHHTRRQGLHLFILSSEWMMSSSFASPSWSFLRTLADQWLESWLCCTWSTPPCSEYIANLLP